MTIDTANVTTDGHAVRSVLDAVYAAWADNDADAFVAPYTVEATALLPGSQLPNRDAIRSTMAAAFAGPLKGSSAIHEVQSIRFLGAEAAIVISKGAILFAGQDEPTAESRTLDTWVLSKLDGSWRVAAYHNCSETAA